MAKISSAAMRLYSKLIRNPDFPASKIDREAASWLRSSANPHWLQFAHSFPSQFLRLLLALEAGSDDHCDALDACDAAHFFFPQHCVIEPPKELLQAESWGEIYDALRTAGESLNRAGSVADMLDYLRTVILASKRIDQKEAMRRAWDKMRVQLNYIGDPDPDVAEPDAIEPDAIEKAKQAVASGKKKAAAGSRRAKKIADPEAEPVAPPGEPLHVPSQPDGFAFDN